jgi:hypothetical protein
MGYRKEFLHKIHYFHVVTRPLLIGQKFYADFKNDLKKFHTISKGYAFSIELWG